jgi:hypothetical protein
MNIFYISLGPDCHTAANLNMLKKRHMSLPFDWLSMSEKLGIKYININIETNFKYFVSNMKKNNKGNYYSEKFPYVTFPHHNFLQDTSEFNKVKLKYFFSETDERQDGTNIDKFKRRTNRFLNIINNPKNKCVFCYHISLVTWKNKDDLQYILEQIKIFLKKCMTKYKFLLYILIKNSDIAEDIPKDQFYNGVYLRVYKIDLSKNKDFGNAQDFKKILDSL